jgi:hypothetical protein
VIAAAWVAAYTIVSRSWPLAQRVIFHFFTVHFASSAIGAGSNADIQHSLTASLLIASFNVYVNNNDVALKSGAP